MSNIADKIYYTLYTIVVDNVIPALSTAITHMQTFFVEISILAVAMLALSMLYQKIDVLTFIKLLTTVFIVMSFFFGGFTANLYLLDLMKDLFIDLPIKIGSIIVSTMSAVLYSGLDGAGSITQTPIEIVPTQNGTTAFGKLWQISTDLANTVWETGGMRNMGAYFLGAALWIVAILMLVAQIFVLGTALIMSAVAIFLSPVFIPMILFKSTRPMFQSWVGFGLGGGFGLLILMIMLGIVFGFISVTFFQLFGVDLSTTDITQLNDINDMGKLSGLLLFMIITIKLLQQVSMWASSLAGASAGGISDGLTGLGGQFLKTTGLATKNTLKNIPDATKAAIKAPGNIKRGIGNGLKGIQSRFSKTPKTGKKTSKANQNLLKAKITQRLAQRHTGQKSNNQRPLSNLANREKRQNKIKALSHMPSNTAQQSKPAQPQAVAVGNSSRPIGASTKTAKRSHNSTSSKSIKEPGATNPGQSPGPKEQKEVKRPVTATSKASGSSKTSLRPQEPKRGAEGKNATQTPKASGAEQKSVNREKVIEKKTQTSKGKANNQGEKPTPPVTVQEKSVNRDKNLSKPSRAQRAEQKQQIDSKPPKPTKEVKRREDSTIKKSKEQPKNEDKK